MIRRLIATSVGAGLLVSFALVASGCSGDLSSHPANPISAPRKGGGIEDTAGEKMNPRQDESRQDHRRLT